MQIAATNHIDEETLEKVSGAFRELFFPSEFGALVHDDITTIVRGLRETGGGFWDDYSGDSFDAERIRSFDVHRDDKDYTVTREDVIGDDPEGIRTMKLTIDCRDIPRLHEDRPPLMVAQLELNSHFILSSTGRKIFGGGNAEVRGDFEQPNPYAVSVKPFARVLHIDLAARRKARETFSNFFPDVPAQ